MSAVRKPRAEPRQLDFDFSSPLDHYEQLFRHQQDYVILWHKDRCDQPKETRDGPVWKSLKPTQTHDALLGVAGQYDKYITPNEFHGWRTSNLLRGLNAVYLDFDIHTKGKRPSQKQLNKWRKEVLAKIKAKGWPEPTFSVMSGRGFHLYWCHHRADRRAVPRWQALIRHMCIELDADRLAVDACRVLRVIGTRNSSADGNFIVHGYEESGQIYNFEWLYETICKPQKAEIREIEKARAARAARKAARATKSDLPKDPKKVSNLFDWYWRLNNDVWKVAAHLSQLNDGRGIPEGKRGLILELFCAAICWFRPPHALEEEVLSFAKRFTPDLTTEQVLRDTATLRKRAAMAADGEMLVYKGERVDARYKYSREKLWEKFTEKHVPPSLWPELEVLIPEDLARERNAAKEKTRQAGRDRVKEGRYASRNTGQGVREVNALKRALARQKAAEGASVASIARELDTPSKTVYSWLKNA